jgi:Fe-S-cluster containining protein
MPPRFSAAQREALRRQDSALIGLPLDMGPSPHSMAAHLRLSARLLRDRNVSSPSAQLMRHLFTLFDRTAPSAQAMGLACRTGCAHCCKQLVTVTAPEAFFVAAQVRKEPDRETAIAATARTLSGLLGSGRWSGVHPCTFLSDMSCSIYQARPFSCRGFVSRDVNACRTFEQSGKAVPMPDPYVDTLNACRMILVAAIRLAGLKDQTFELNAAVTAALATDDTEKRWLRGEPVFAGIEAGPAPPSDFEGQIARMVAFVAPSL